MKNRIPTCLMSGLLLLLVGMAAQAQPSAFFQAVTNLNPVAYWPLQETVLPPVADVETNLGSLGAVANAYYSSTNVVKGFPGINSGDSDLAVSCQSGLNGGFLAVPLTDSRVVLPAGAFSVEAWIYPTNVSASTIVAQTGVAGSGGLNGGANSAGWSLNLGYVPSLGINMGGTVTFHVYNGVGSTGGAEATFAQSGFAINTWYHVVGVFDGANAILYVNGVTNAPITVPMTGTQARDTWNPLTIGCGRGLNNNRFGGGLDEVAIYTNALSVTQVGNHYNAGINSSGTYLTTIQGDNPYMYWRMDAPAYAPPAISAYPAAMNYGTAANANGLYLSGTTPGVARNNAAFGSPSYACAFNGIGTDATNAVTIFTNGVAYSTNTVASSGVLVTNLDNSLRLASNNFTMICWFKSNPANQFSGLMGANNAGQLYLDGGSGAVRFNPGYSSAPDISPVTKFNDGNWHFIAGVTSLGTSNSALLVTNILYVDGIQDALSTSTTLPGAMTNITPMLGGLVGGFTASGNGNAYNQRFLPGSLAHAAYFSNALSASQIAGLYATAGAVPQPSITGQPITGRARTVPPATTAAARAATSSWA